MDGDKPNAVVNEVYLISWNTADNLADDASTTADHLY